MTDYILYIDYKANVPGCGYLYTRLNATDLVAAMCEAEKQWYSQDVYLMRIMEKVGKSEKDQGTWRKQKYNAILCRRSGWWFANDKDHYEQEHKIFRYNGTGKNKEYEWFEIAPNELGPL